jgi:nitrate/nitrite-specific signal transduction histidine kinase
VNRAGQLRMLSQRLVALAAQRLAGVEPAHARELAATALERARANVAHLAGLPLAQGEGAQALGEVQQAATALEAALAGRPDARALLRADVLAETLLDAADRLAGTLQARGARGPLAVVNLCGSQRMRVQRLLKDALLSRVAPAPERAARLAATLAEFDEVQRRVAAAPLSSQDIRAALAAADEGWLAVQRAWRGGDLAALCHAGEHLLTTLDQLTECCERSLQVLLS